MATGGTAAPVALAKPAQSLLDPSDSNMSSPLSEVEDKDGDTDDMEIDLNGDFHSKTLDVDRTHDGVASPAQSASAVPDDDESNLSDVDVNDSEAETERLDDSPHKNNTLRDTVVLTTSPSGKLNATSRDRAFERSPSKLQQQIQADVDAEAAHGEDDAASDDDEHDEHESDDASSVALSDPEPRDESLADANLPTQILHKKSESRDVKTIVATVEGANKDTSSESRKRKRSLLAEQSETDQPVRKRTGSIAAVDRETPSVDQADADEGHDSASLSKNGGVHSGEDEGHESEALQKMTDVAESIEPAAGESRRPLKSKRNVMKKRKETEEEHGGDDEGVEAVPEHTEELAADEGHIAEEDEHAEAEADEEAEAAHRNEEELERKRAAFDQLSSIEKHFTTFRERLYEERLAQLEEEEAMLKGDNPTHPEYLAMMECIDARRDERLRVIDLEFRYNVESLNRWAVSRRTQILGQFYQSVRATREKALEDLGRQWYEIQHERRQYANSVPDYGIRFPSTKTQQKRQAIAHNKEVSILSGIARYEGFPAAPDMKGAAAGEIDDDLDAINKARQSLQQTATGSTPALQEYGGLSFGRSLGPAGEQFLEQTPWANPNHPAHQVQRHSQQETPTSSAVPELPAPMKLSQHQSDQLSSIADAVASAASLLNGKTPTPTSTRKPLPNGHDRDTPKASKTGPDTIPKREAVAQAS